MNTLTFKRISKDQIERVESFENIEKKDRLVISITDILYITSTKSRYFKSINLGDKKILWKTNDTFEFIIEGLGIKEFVRIHKSYVIRKRLISGRDNTWDHLLLTANKSNKYITLQLKIGKCYLGEITEYLNNLSLIEVKDLEGNILFVNPMNIIYVESTGKKRIKKLHLDKPVYANKKSNFQLKWVIGKSLDELFDKPRMDMFLQINKFQIVNLSFVREFSLLSSSLCLCNGLELKFNPSFRNRVLKSYEVEINKHLGNHLIAIETCFT